MESGSELSKTVAVFILEKIIMDQHGLSYVCQTSDRFYAVATVLKSMVSTSTAKLSLRLLKHVIRCFLRLAEHSKACEALKDLLPRSLSDGTIASMVRPDAVATKWLQSLVDRIS
jgi:CCR4-NOT transcription complex subunit 9